MEQLRYYHRGVGTGVLDRVSGGAFGLGLEQKVRDAYNWLIEHYRGDPNPRRADELFIFGFSRGAYTARSLVGLIMRFGLLRRGAPLTVNQLWEAYEEFGKFHIGRREKRPFRDLPQLITDPWQGNRQRWTEDNPPNDIEGLLLQWSRRIPVQFLGLYDTVAAMGLHAMGVPGLPSLTVPHNMRLSAIVRRCYHALAIDEHRSSFSEVPLLQYEGYGDDWDDATCTRERRRWDKRVQQRWFLGAHANIGGGYDSNRLGSYPLSWMLEGAQEFGLVLNAPISRPAALTAASEVRDSYGDFLKGVWRHLIRAKRNYRPLNPPLIVRASADQSLPNYSLRFVNPNIDDSALRLADADPSYCAPNLIAYAEQQVTTLAPEEQEPPVQEEKSPPPEIPTDPLLEDPAREEALPPEPTPSPRKKTTRRKPPLKKTTRKISARKTAKKAAKKAPRKTSSKKVSAKKKTTRKKATKKKTTRKRAHNRAMGATGPRQAIAPPSNTETLDREAIFRRLAQRASSHHWLPSTASRFWFTTWCLLALWGISSLTTLFSFPQSCCGILLSIFGCILVLVDWTESRQRFSLARFPHASPFRRTLADYAMALRALGVLCMAFGALSLLVHVISESRAAPSWEALLPAARDLLVLWWLPSLTVVMVIALLTVPRDLNQRALSVTFRSLMASVFSPVILALLVSILALINHWFRMATHQEIPAIDPPGGGEAGVLLFLHTLAVILLALVHYAIAPMRRAQLGTPSALARSLTPRRVTCQLSAWQRLLTPAGSDPSVPAHQRLQNHLGISLWRQIGLVPFAAALFGLALWSVHTTLDWTSLDRALGPAPLWFWLVTLFLVAALSEQFIHLSHLACFTRGQAPDWLQVLFGHLTSSVARLSLLALIITLTAVWGSLVWEVWTNPQAHGERGVLASLLSVPVGVILATCYLQALGRWLDALAHWLNASESEAPAKDLTSSGEE